MIPNILEYEDRRVKVTPQAYAIPEIKALLDKYDMEAEAYLTYIYDMSAPNSPYINIPREEKSEAIIYDIQATIGDFDWEDPLLQEAIDKMRSLYTSPNVLLAEEAAEELHKLRKWLQDTPYGNEENVKTRIGLLKELGKVSTEYLKVREQADKEMKIATKGDHEVGTY